MVIVKFVSKSGLKQQGERAGTAASKYEEAIENYKKAIELGREDSWIYSEIAWTYFLLGKFTEALEYMNKAKELSPVEVDPLLVSRTSSILVALGKHAEAIKILEEIMSKEEYKDNIGIGGKKGIGKKRYKNRRKWENINRYKSL